MALASRNAQAPQVDANFIGRAPAAFGGERSRFRPPRDLLALGANASSTAVVPSSYKDDDWSRKMELGSIVQCISGHEVVVDIDPEKGPIVLLADGGTGYMDFTGSWKSMRASDQKVTVYKAAQKNVKAAEARKQLEAKREEQRKAEEAAAAARKAKEEAEAAKKARQLALEQVEKAGQESPEARVLARCKMECERAPFFWQTIGPDVVKENHTKRAKGKFFDLEFPWNEELLVEFGPEWLTKAFHATGVLNKDNRVTEIIREPMKIDAGNNAGKFLFEVRYEKKQPGLNEKLFAKCPFAMTPETMADRISSSVYKQPMDMMEINTYRLVEGYFPMKTPKFYFGDISNETSNFILITERVAFAETGGRKPSLQPYEVEGPYDKCKDYQLRGDPKEYYSLLITNCARIAGYHKAGKFGTDEFLTVSLGGLRAHPSDPAGWGVNPAACTGEAPADKKRKLEVAHKFFSDTAKQLYPEYVKTPEFETKFKNTLMKWNAYAAEVTYFKNCKMDYIALGHQNLNADNAYFWRKEDGSLDCGMYDWGGFGNGSIGHKIWWMFNCADFDQVKDNLPHYINLFAKEYKDAGGPAVDYEEIEMMVLLTVLENTNFMVLAVPNCFKMCQMKEFATIKDRSDPRIADNIHGKSTLRTTIHVLGNGIRAIEELKVDQVLDKFIKDIWVNRWGNQPKSDSIIFGS